MLTCFLRKAALKLEQHIKAVCCNRIITYNSLFKVFESYKGDNTYMAARYVKTVNAEDAVKTVGGLYHRYRLRWTMETWVVYILGEQGYGCVKQPETGRSTIGEKWARKCAIITRFVIDTTPVKCW